MGGERRWVFVVYLLALNTAARAGEVWGLRPSDLKDVGQMVQTQGQYNRLLNDSSPTKGKKNQRGPCNKLLREEIDALIRQGRIQDHEPVFQTENRRPIGHDNFVKRCFKRDAEEWGGKKIRFHDLRHTATTLMIASGLYIKTVQEICGHQGIQTTMTDVHLLAERTRDAAKLYAIGPEVETAATPLNAAELGEFRFDVDHRKLPETKKPAGNGPRV